MVRWRASDLIVRLHEEFGLSVSDDTIYRALHKWLLASERAAAGVQAGPGRDRGVEERMARPVCRVCAG